MKTNKRYQVTVDEAGLLLLPAELSERWQLNPGDKLDLVEQANALELNHPVHQLARVYLEPTNECNLECSTCMRNVWDEAPGYMSEYVFKRFLTTLQDFTPLPEVFFGGYGEPLGHPRIIKMIAELKSMGVTVELITNGTLLTEARLKSLIKVGLDRLWVSIDGATPASYADVRLGDRLPQIISNLRKLQELKLRDYLESPRLGIAFVAMKRNIQDLPDVLRLGHSLGADRFSISNLLPHTPDLAEEILYERCMNLGELLPTPGNPLVSMPRMDINPVTLAAMGRILRGSYTLTLGQQQFGEVANQCPFVEKRSTSIRWDGALSPCLALLHEHESYLDDRLRKPRAYWIGNIREKSLMELWMDPIYIDLRDRLRTFDFSPCSFCNSCEYASSNQEDCFGNILPACGGCLWAQGLIQCP